MESNKIKLELDIETAQALYDLLYYCVGGSPTNSRRKYTDIVYNALVQSPIHTRQYGEVTDIDIDGTIYWKG